MRIITLALLIIFSFSCNTEKPQAIEAPPPPKHILDPSTVMNKEEPNSTVSSLPASTIEKYKKTQQLIKENKGAIFEVVANSQPAVKSQMTKYLKICLQENDPASWLAKTGKPTIHVTKFMEAVDFFMIKIEDAKKFKPNARQVDLYNQLKSFLERDRAIVDKFLNDRNPNFTHADLQRQRMYRNILDNDIKGYLYNTVVTEAEFEKNTNFLVDEWKILSNDMVMYYRKRE